jgi:hypothetical protein
MPIKDPVKRAEYHKQYMKDRYRNDAVFRAAHQTRVRRVAVRRVAEIRDEIAEFKKTGCLLCPENEPCCLVAHHTDPKQKDFDIAQAATHQYGRARFTRELAKCVCLCENCHRKVHAGKKKLSARVRNTTTVREQHAPEDDEVPTLKHLGLDRASMDETWERAKQHMRDRGEDPDAILAQAAANLAAWRALPEEERQRQQQQATEEWLKWEATVDDAGNPIKVG